METFCAVGDTQLCELISAAKARVVYAAAGISGDVAKAIGVLLDAGIEIDVTVIIDPDEEVCRIGYGDQEGLAVLQQRAQRLTTASA